MSEARLSGVFRALHWGIAVIVFLNAFILEEGKDLHRYIGYTAFVFVLIRVLIGSRKQVSHYNNKAQYVYWCIWICIGGLATSGFFMGLDRFWGNQKLEDIHEMISNILLALVSIHLFGMLLDSVVHKRKTWMVMITGKKE